MFNAFFYFIVFLSIASLHGMPTTKKEAVKSNFFKNQCPEELKALVYNAINNYQQKVACPYCESKLKPSSLYRHFVYKHSKERIKEAMSIKRLLN